MGADRAKARRVTVVPEQRSPPANRNDPDAGLSPSGTRAACPVGSFSRMTSPAPGPVAVRLLEHTRNSAPDHASAGSAFLASCPPLPVPGRRPSTTASASSVLAPGRPSSTRTGPRPQATGRARSCAGDGSRANRYAWRTGMPRTCRRVRHSPPARTVVTAGSDAYRPTRLPAVVAAPALAPAAPSASPPPPASTPRSPPARGPPSPTPEQEARISRPTGPTLPPGPASHRARSAT